MADTLDGSVGVDRLAAEVAERAHFGNAADLVGQLTSRGLLSDGRLTTAGSGLVDGLQAALTAETAPIWHDLPAEDVVAATRILNEVVARARLVLG